MKQTELTIGCKVKCIKKSDTGFFGKVGQIYTVSDFDVSFNRDWIRLKEDRENLRNDFERFSIVYEKPVSKEKQKAIEILNKLKKEIDKYEKLVENMN